MKLRHVYWWRRVQVAYMLNCQKAEDAIFNRKRKFLTKYASLDNLICYVCQNFANAEAAAVSAKS